MPVALCELPTAESIELDIGRFGPVRKVWVPVAELCGQVERQPLGELDGHRDGVRVVGKPRGRLGRGKKDELVVPPALRLAAVEGSLLPDRDERVLQPCPAWMVGVDVARGDRAHSEVTSQIPQRRVPAGVSAQVRTLELDEEPLAAERVREPGCGVRIPHREPVSRAAREADEAFVQIPEPLGIERGLEPVLSVALGQETAEVRVALRRFGEERDVRAADECHLGAGDRPDPERLGGMGELERAVDPVVIGQRERRVAELGCARRQLLRL